jgi:hypothetical protein
MEARRDLQQRAGMIPRLIERQHDALRGASAHRTGKRLQRHVHDRRVEGGGERPLAAPRGGMDEGEQVAPRETVLHACDGVRWAAVHAAPRPGAGAA